MFFGNSNDLALQLTLGITVFMVLFFLSGIWKQIVGLSGILICLMYMLKTGSRGCLVALMLLAVVVFLISKRKLGLIIMAAAARYRSRIYPFQFGAQTRAAIPKLERSCE